MLCGGVHVRARWESAGGGLYIARVGAGREVDGLRAGNVTFRQARYPHATEPDAPYEGGAAEAAVAILSCALSYEVIARQILRENPQADRHPFYGEWVQGYASDEYHAANLDIIRLTEKLTAGCTEEQKKKLDEIFINCSLYEGAFWDMAWEKRK